MGVSTFGMWFIGVALVLLLGCGFISIKSEFAIKRIERDGWGKRTGKYAPRWLHWLELITLGLGMLGLILLIIAFKCLFWPGPLCTSIYH